MARGLASDTSSRLPRAVQRGYARYLKRALALPLAEESSSYGTPAVKVRGKLLSRWRAEAEGALAIRCDFLDREILLETQPEVFFVTEHYAGHPWVLVHLDRISSAQLDELLARAWQRVAPVRAAQARAAPPRARRTARKPGTRR